MADGFSAGSAPSAGPRHLRARPALPSGRALLGGFLVAAAMVLTFTLASTSRSGPTQSVVVARRPIPVGHRVSPDDLRLAPATVGDDVRTQLFTQIGDVAGSVSLVAVAPDGVIGRGTVVRDGGTAAASGREFSFPVDRERAVNGRLQAGEVVDLLVTYGTGPQARTQVVADGVPVLEITEATKATLGSGGRLVVTVALPDPDQLLRAAHASQVGSLTVVRATTVTDGEADGDYTTTLVTSPAGT